MALPIALNDREHQKFIDVSPGKTAVRVSTDGLLPPQYDRVDVTYPTSSSEVYDFSFGGSSVGTVTLTYTNSSKNDLLSAVKS